MAIALLLAAMSSSVASAGGKSNAAGAKACQKGGWAELQTSTGGAFASQSACVSYTANGGTLFKPQLTLHCIPGYYFGIQSGIYWTGTGFSPNSTGHVSTAAAASFEFSWSVTTDADGAVWFSWPLNGNPAPA
jgi:hypothetical protein